MKKIYQEQLKQLVKDDKFNALLQLYSEIDDQWKNENPKADTEFQTLWNLAYRQGKIEGLKAFFDNLDKEIYDR